MDDYDGLSRPPQLPRILEATRKEGFLKTSDLLVGDLLRTLAATKPGGRLLEIRTGTGIATAWLLGGMDDAASPASVDRNSRVQAVAQEILGDDGRVGFFVGEAKAFLESEPAESYDLIFADGQAGNFTDLDLGLSRLQRGALYIVDNMFMQLFHPPERAAGLREFRSALDARSDLLVAKIGWASGVVVCVRRG
jgi:predicted O-methyltransferase YrrM